MKKIVLLLVALLISVTILAQDEAIERIFNKYKGREGITTVQISPELFQVVNAMDVEEMDRHEFPFDKVASVRILTIEDEEGWEDVNFYEEIKNDLDMNEFADVMTVDDGDETVRMWMKADQGKILEFLLIVGGDDNVLIHITGNFSMKDLEGLEESIDRDMDMHL